MLFKVGGLNQLEGKGSQQKTFQLLCYMAQQGIEWNFFHQEILERIVGRFFNRPEENLGKIGLEIRQFIKVFGQYEIRNRYLRKRYSTVKIKTNTNLGKLIFDKLFIIFFDTSPIHLKIRKRGYDDHGKDRPDHEYHGEKERDEVNMPIKLDTQEILLDVYKRSTLNYLQWLKNLENHEEASEQSKGEIRRIHQTVSDSLNGLQTQEEDLNTYPKGEKNEHSSVENPNFGAAVQRTSKEDRGLSSSTGEHQQEEVKNSDLPPVSVFTGKQEGIGYTTKSTAAVFV